MPSKDLPNIIQSKSTPRVSSPAIALSPQFGTIVQSTIRTNSRLRLPPMSMTLPSPPPPIFVRSFILLKTFKVSGAM